MTTSKKSPKTTETCENVDPRPSAGDALGNTMEELAELYLQHLEAIGKSRGTVFSYSIDIALAAREIGKETRIKMLTPEAVGAFFASDAVTKTRTGKAKAKPTIDKTRRVLRLALVWAVEAGLLPVAPLPAQAEKAAPAPEKKKARPARKAKASGNGQGGEIAVPTPEAAGDAAA